MNLASPHDEQFTDLCRTLANHAGEVDLSGNWPALQLNLLGDAGVFAWFIPEHAGGRRSSDADLLRAYIALGRSCLTTAFILTQRQGAMGRIAGLGSEFLRHELLPDLLSGRIFATIGISHLTTSRRHLGRPALRAEVTADGFRLDGLSPWVTGARFAQHVVLGATLDDDRQILVVLPTDLPGVSLPAAEQLVALSASHTGPLVCESVFVERKWLLAGPAPDLMKQGGGSRTGGLQTSALALGLSSAAIAFLAQEGEKRADLLPAAEGLSDEYAELEGDLFAVADNCGHTTADNVRARANSLVLRATQASLAAAKGAGFVAGHPAGRWCREALFFLVWSCPQPVLAANLCELAGIQ